MTGVQTCALPIYTANTEMLTSVPNTTLSLVSLSLQTINGKDVFDDAGLPYVYGASKILDMLGYGSFLAFSNTAKSVITKAYLGKDNVADADNPLVYSASQVVNLLSYSRNDVAFWYHA